MGDKIERIKTHIEKHKVAYACTATTVIVAGITAIIMRSVAMQSISSSVTGTAGSSVTGTGKRVAISNISFISANRQGPPSWVVRCKETGDIFTSQRSAALEMGIIQTNISKHLNGFQDNAEGFHFERICMAG